MTYKTEDFDLHCKLFAEILIANGNHWKDYHGAAYSTRMTECIKNVREACDVMENILKADKDLLCNQEPSVLEGAIERHREVSSDGSVRRLTEEEYKAKVAKGKKIKLAEGGAH